jgi:hypothetical protein
VDVANPNGRENSMRWRDVLQPLINIVILFLLFLLAMIFLGLFA